MTKKDYEKIAGVIRLAIDCPVNENDMFEVGMLADAKGIARDMADMLAKDNPRFDRARFLEACGL